jgi:hypothetical protein
MLGQILTDYPFLHYPQWHWVEMFTPPVPIPLPIPIEIPIIHRRKRAFSTDTKGANQDIYTGIAPIDTALTGLYKSMGNLAGEA